MCSCVPSQALVTRDGKPLTQSTKWEDLSPHGQQYLLELECGPTCCVARPLGHSSMFSGSPGGIDVSQCPTPAVQLHASAGATSTRLPLRQEEAIR